MKKKSEEPDYQELREEFRAFLRSTKDNVDLYLWFALANLAEREVSRKPWRQLAERIFGLGPHEMKPRHDVVEEARARGGKKPSPPYQAWPSAV